MTTLPDDCESMKLPVIPRVHNPARGGGGGGGGGGLVVVVVVVVVVVLVVVVVVDFIILLGKSQQALPFYWEP